MAMSAPRPCSHPGCGALVVDGSGRCAKHPKATWAKHPEAVVKRISGRRLQRLRAELFAREPLCRACASQGLVTVATERDHIKPLEEGGTDALENIQPLCRACHEVKSKRESARGVVRSYSSKG